MEGLKFFSHMFSQQPPHPHPQLRRPSGPKQVKTSLGPSRKAYQVSRALNWHLSVLGTSLQLLHGVFAHSRCLLTTDWLWEYINGGLWWPSQFERMGNKRKTLTFGFGIHYIIPLQWTSGLASANINGVRAACGVTGGGHHAVENLPQGKPHVDHMELLTVVSIQMFPQVSPHAF